MWKIIAGCLAADGVVFAIDHRIGALAMMIGILVMFVAIVFRAPS